jgi:hypothetical protein
VERARARRPLQVFVEQDTDIIFANSLDWTSFPYYFDCEPSHLPINPPSRGVEWWKWARDNHGQPAVHSEIAVTLTTRPQSTVVVDSFRASMLDVSPAPPGCVVVHPVGGADIIQRQASIVLSSMPATVTFVEAGSGDETSGFTFALSAGQPARLSITARVADRAYIYEWVGHLELIVAGKRRTAVISNGGRPFRLHGGANCLEYEWTDGAWSRSNYLGLSDMEDG